MDIQNYTKGPNRRLIRPIYIFKLDRTLFTMARNREEASKITNVDPEYIKHLAQKEKASKGFIFSYSKILKDKIDLF